MEIKNKKKDPQKNIENEDKRNNSYLMKDIIYNCLFFLIIIIIILIILLIEKLIYTILLTIFFTRFISIPTQILFHILYLRYLILQIIFAFNNTFLSRQFIYDYGLNIANVLHESFSSFYDSLSLLNNNTKLFSLDLNTIIEIKSQIEMIQKLIKKEIDLFTKIKNRFNSLTNDQQIFYNNLNNLNDSLGEGHLLQFFNLIINKIQNNDRNSINNCPTEIQNEISTELFKNYKNFQNLLFFCRSILEQIIDYKGSEYNTSGFRKVRNYFNNNLFASKEQFQCELDNFFKYEIKNFITKDKCKIEYIIIKNNSLYKTTDKLMIICGPNGVPYEIFSRNNIFKCYLDSNIDILCWNYRGYGLSEGAPSFDFLRSDILELFDEIKKMNKYKHFGVHGTSIGGIPCCHLASNRKEIEIMVCDRNFGKLDYYVQNFIFGQYLYIFYKLLFFQSSDNVDNYLSADCYKIIMNDSHDEIVFDICSLKTLISAKLCKKYFECNINNDNLLFVNDYNSIMNTELESLKNKNINIITKKIKLNRKISKKIGSKKNRQNAVKSTALDKIFNSFEDKNNFVNILLNISYILNSNKQKAEKGYSKIKQLETDFFNFIENNLLDIFNSLESAGNTFSTILNNKSNYTKSIFIDNFFNNLFIWGSHNNNIECNTRNIETNFNEFMNLFLEFLNSNELKSYKNQYLVKEIEQLYKYFLIIQKNIKYVGLYLNNNFIKLINYNKKNGYEECLMELNRGNFINLKCGHNGSLHPEEIELFYNYLMNSNFFSLNKNDEKDDNDSDEEKEDNEEK